MPLSTSKINMFTLFKLPSVFFTGVRVKELTETTCVTTVKHRWINQNPFNSLFWAVQGMAAELSTGAMVIGAIEDSGKKISMLVANNKATFNKKAKGRINFTCNDGHLIADAIAATIANGEGQTFWMKSTGTDQQGDVVSVFEFEWTVRVKSK